MSSSIVDDTTTASAELDALDRQNEQLAFLRDQAQKTGTDQTYMQARLQSIRSWTGFVRKLYNLFAAFFLVVLAGTLPTGGGWGAIALRALIALLVVVFPFCVPGIAAEVQSAAASAGGFVRAHMSQYRLATGT